MGPGGARRGRGRGKNRISSCGEDRISGLPDHLLHSILLPAAPDHRHPHQRPVAPLALVWAHLPALSFNEWVHHHQQRHCIYDGIDAAWRSSSTLSPSAGPPPTASAPGCNSPRGASPASSSSCSSSRRRAVGR
ncbi:unnamed protein product [Urochloa humidicola]